MRLSHFKLLIALFLFVRPGIALAQTSTKKNIDYIRSVFTAINSRPNLEQLKVENEQLTDEVPDGGISLIGFFNNNTLLKIEQWAGLSHGVIQLEYYFDKDSLVFVFVRESHFRQSGDTLDHSKMDVKFEGRYYFKKDLLIYQTNKGNGFWSDSNDGVQSLLPDSKTYFKFLKLKKTNDG